MILVPNVLAAIAAFASPAAPSAAAASFLSAASSGDLPAARALLAEDVTIMDASGAAPAASSLEAYAHHLRGCSQTNVVADVDADNHARTALTVSWSCTSGARVDDLIWMDHDRVTWIQFGNPATH